MTPCSTCDRSGLEHAKDCTIYAPAPMCDSCRRGPGVQQDRWGDPICQACVDHMAAVGRTP